VALFSQTRDETETAEGEVRAIVRNGKAAKGLKSGEEGALILNQTPFYGESGGQIGDQGLIKGPKGALFRVSDTQKKLGDLIVHVGTVENRSLYAIHPALWAVSVIVLAVLALRYGRTRAGWPLAVALSVLATPRLLLYQLMTLLAGASGPQTAERTAPAAATPTTPSPLGRASGAVGR